MSTLEHENPLSGASPSNGSMKSTAEMLSNSLCNREKKEATCHFRSWLHSDSVVLFHAEMVQSTASVFPAENTDLFSGMAHLLAGDSISRQKAFCMTGNSDLDRYVAILKSERG